MTEASGSKRRKKSLRFSTTHECVFVEEQERSGRLVLPPCIVCGIGADFALGQVKDRAETAEQRCRDAMDDLTLTQMDLAGVKADLMRYMKRDEEHRANLVRSWEAVRRAQADLTAALDGHANELSRREALEEGT